MTCKCSNNGGLYNVENTSSSYNDQCDPYQANNNTEIEMLLQTLDKVFNCQSHNEYKPASDGLI